MDFVGIRKWIVIFAISAIIIGLFIFTSCDKEAEIDVATPSDSIGVTIATNDDFFEDDDFYTPSVTMLPIDTPIIEATNNGTAATPSPQQSGTSNPTPSQAVPPQNVPLPSPTTEQEVISAIISLSNSDINVIGIGVVVNDTVVTITEGGVYEIRGTLSNGQIVVNVSKEERVYIKLMGVNITCLTNSPIYIQSCEKTVLTLVPGTVNTFTDSNRYSGLNTEGEPNSCIFSKDDLTISGLGKMIVNANYNNGITSKDDLKITGGDIVVSAVTNAIKGSDSVMVRGGKLLLTAGKDGIKASNVERIDKGYVLIEGGDIEIDAYDDGIQAPTYITISGGRVKVTARSEKFKCDVQNIDESCLV